MKLKHIYDEMEERAQEGLYREAIAIGRNAQTSIDSSIEEESLVHAVNILCLLARLLRKVEAYEEGKELYHKALKLETAILGKSAPMVAETLNNLACHLRILREDDKVIELLKESIQIKEEHFGKNCRESLKPLTNLMAAYDEMKLYDEAMGCGYRAENVCRIQNMERSEDMATVKEYLGYSLLHLNCLNKANDAFLKAFNIRRKIHPGNHILLAESYRALGIVHERKKNYGASETMYRHAQSIFEAHYSPWHEECAKNLQTIAWIVCQQGRSHLAGPLYKRAVSLCIAHLGAIHPSVVFALTSLATFYESSGENEQGQQVREIIDRIRKERKEKRPHVAKYIRENPQRFVR